MLEMVKLIEAGDVLLVRTTGVMPQLIRWHESLHHPGICPINHLVPVVEDEDMLKHVIQIAPPYVTVVPLLKYIKWMQKKGHLWHCARPSWLDPTFSGEEHAAGIIKAWRHAFSRYALSTKGNKYPKRDIIRLVLYDISGGRINYGNIEQDYCAETPINGWVAAAHCHHVPDSVDTLKFAGPYDYIKLMQDKDILPICGNSPWILRSILYKGSSS